MFGRKGGTSGPPDFADITRMLDELKLKYQPFPEKKAILVPFEGEHATHEVFILVDKDKAILYLAVGAYFSVPDTHPNFTAIMRRLMELNWELSIAKVEWDSSDGEVRLSQAITTENGVGTEALGVTINYLVRSADKHYLELRQLIG